MAPLPHSGTDVERRVSELQRGIKVEENFRWIYSRYFEAVFHFFAKRGISPDKCDDLTQEVFLRVYRGIGRFRGEAKFETWLFRIAWNLLCKELRNTIQERKKVEMSLDETAEPDGLPAIEAMAAVQGDENSPLLSALSEERRVLLHRELQNMPPQMRRCMLLRVGRGLKYREIAALMQISIDAVKSHLNQARSRLKVRLRETPGEKDR